MAQGTALGQSDGGAAAGGRRSRPGRSGPSRALIVSAQVGSLLDQRIAQLAVSGDDLGLQASARKLIGVRYRQNLAEFRMELSAGGGLVVDERVSTLNTRCLTIAGGSEQILLTLWGAPARPAPLSRGSGSGCRCSGGQVVAVPLPAWMCVHTMKSALSRAVRRSSSGCRRRRPMNRSARRRRSRVTEISTLLTPGDFDRTLSMLAPWSDGGDPIGALYWPPARRVAVRSHLDGLPWPQSPGNPDLPGSIRLGLAGKAPALAPRNWRCATAAGSRRHGKPEPENCPPRPPLPGRDEGEQQQWSGQAGTGVSCTTVIRSLSS